MSIIIGSMALGAFLAGTNIGHKIAKGAAIAGIIMLAILGAIGLIVSH